MGVLQQISKRLGFGGSRPKFNAENNLSTLHYQSSINNNPKITKSQSILDEGDAFNNNKFKSAKGQKYNDNIPK